MRVSPRASAALRARTAYPCGRRHRDAAPPASEIHCARPRRSLRCPKRGAMSQISQPIRARPKPPTGFGWCTGWHFRHAALTENALACRPPAYGESPPGGRARIAIPMEAMTAMTLLYNRIKEEGRREGLAMARAEAREKMIAEGKKIGREIGFVEGKREGFVEGKREGFIEGKRKGFVEGVDATLESMREVGVDEEPIRRVEDILARRAWRNLL